MTDQSYYHGVKFVDDDPADTDEFRGLPHERVAGALVSILEVEGGGRAIGLEGSWGSGKSTVVEIAQNRLKGRGNEKPDVPAYTFFVFDAWAHQGDPLRRVILQELIQCLDSHNAVDRTYWEEKLRALETSRRQVTESKAEKLSLVARASLIIVPLLPIAYGLISKSDKFFEITLPTIGLVCVPYWTVGLALVSVPFLAALGTLFSWRAGWGKSWKIWTYSWWKRKSEKKGKSVIWAFTRQTDEVTTEQFIREEEATTIEFNEIFDELIEDAAAHNHRVVIVFDNLDRLPRELIRETWATMRNFFAATPGTARKETLRNVWLIVPFDRIHIEAVFDLEKNGEIPDATPGFIEKTFEIILRVSPPILSNWREFLAVKFESAFGDKIPREELHQIYNIFEIFYRDQTRQITPRIIKSFVNMVAAQAKQWGDAMPIEHQALYALYKKEISSNIKNLQDSSIIDSRIEVQLANRDWTRSLAAAHYNVPPEEAIEVLLWKEIDAAIKNDNISRLNELNKTSGFFVIFDGYISDQLQSDLGSISKFFNVASTIGRIDFKDDVIHREMWRKIARHLNNLAGPAALSPKTREGFECLLEHCPASEKKAVASNLITILAQPYKSIPEPFDEVGAEWYEHLATITRYAPSDGTWKEILKVPIQAGISFLFSIIRAGGADLDFSMCTPRDTPLDIADGLIIIIQEEVPTEDLEFAIRAFVRKPECVTWLPVIEAIASRLKGNAPTVTGEVALRLIAALRALSHIKSIQSDVSRTFDELKNDSTLHGLLQLGISEKNDELKTAAVYLIMNYGEGALAGAAEHPKYGSLSAANSFISEAQKEPLGKISIESLAGQAAKDKFFTRVMTKSLDSGDEKNIYREVLRFMIKTENFNELNVNQVLVKIREISDILGNELIEKFIRKFDNWDISEHISVENISKISPYFLEYSKPLGTKHYISILEQISHKASALTLDDWRAELDGEGAFLAQILKVIKLNESINLGDSFFDALKAHTEAIIEGNAPPKKFSALWHSLPEHLSNTRLKQFSKWWRDKLIDKAPNEEVLIRSFSLLGPSVVKAADLSAKPEDSMRAIIDPLLADESGKGIDVSLSNVPSFAKVISSASDGERNSVVERLSTKFATSDEQKKEKIIQLAKELGVDLKAPEPSAGKDDASDTETETSEG